MKVTPGFIKRMIALSFLNYCILGIGKVRVSWARLDPVRLGSVRLD